VDLADSVRRFWDADAATYDRSLDHGAGSPALRAAWNAALERLLPPAPARILDVGAGTGFLSLAAARLGHQVTSLDLSPGMLAHLRTAAEREGLDIEIVEGGAEQPPPGPFAAVVERHLMWTLPDPAGALSAWREAAPSGRLLLLETMHGVADPVERLRGQARERLRRLRGEPDHHHDQYHAELVAELPLARGIHPDGLVGLVERAGWSRIRLERLRDVEWAHLLAQPPISRPLGTAPRLAIVAESLTRA
jgi:SAM-dependent methyltransferase